jgi:hypothetical protein
MKFADKVDILLENGHWQIAKPGKKGGMSFIVDRSSVDRFLKSMLVKHKHKRKK